MRSAGLPLTVGYTGHRWDPAIGQYFAPFRYYNPQTARWNIRDPLGYVDGPNFYAYVTGKPTVYSDKKGLCGGLPCVALAAASFGALLLILKLSKFTHVFSDNNEKNKEREKRTRHKSLLSQYYSMRGQFFNTFGDMNDAAEDFGGAPEAGFPSPDDIASPVVSLAGQGVGIAVDVTTDIANKITKPDCPLGKQGKT
jgi:RHS repeat-associated protein